MPVHCAAHTSQKLVCPPVRSRSLAIVTAVCRVPRCRPSVLTYPGLSPSGLGIKLSHRSIASVGCTCAITGNTRASMPARATSAGRRICFRGRLMTKASARSGPGATPVERQRQGVSVGSWSPGARARRQATPQGRGTNRKSSSLRTREPRSPHPCPRTPTTWRLWGVATSRDLQPQPTSASHAGVQAHCPSMDTHSRHC